jgi:Sulfatase-modifying factor enzyme 1/TIR domain
MPRKVFISYRRADAKYPARDIHKAFCRTLPRDQVFMDVDSIPPGANFRKTLKDWVDQCEVLLALISSGWIDASDPKTGRRRLDNEGDFVRIEIGEALARDIKVVPVLIDGTLLPDRDLLPDDLKGLVDRQAEFVEYRTFDADVERLIRKLGLSPDKGFRHEMAGHARDVAELMADRRWGRMVAAVVALVLGGYVAAYQFGAPVWWPSFNLAGKTTDAAEATRKADEAEAKRIAEAARDPALSVSPGSGKTFQDRLADGTPCPTCPQMVVVPAGEFLMGSTPSEIVALTKELPRLADRWKAEGPQRRATIPRAFAVGSFAVTFAEWDACIADRGCNGYEPKTEWGRGKQPAINVTWDDAKAYGAWLSRKTGKTYRLLSEAEREYATRAGTTTAFWWGSSISTSQANYNGNYTLAGGAKGEFRGKTVPVDSFAPNPWGLLQRAW